MEEIEIDHICARLLALLYVYGSEEFIVQKPLQQLCMGCAKLFKLEGGEVYDYEKAELFKKYLLDLAKDRSKPFDFVGCLSVEDALKIGWVKEMSKQFNVFSRTKPKKNKNRRKSESVPKVRQAETEEVQRL